MGISQGKTIATKVAHFFPVWRCKLYYGPHYRLLRVSQLNIAHTIYHDSAVMWLGMHELAYLATLLSLTLKYHAVTLRNQMTHRETQTHSTYWTKVHQRVQSVKKSTTHRLVSMFLSTLSSGSASLTFINKIEWRKSLLIPLWVGLSQHSRDIYLRT